MPGGFDFPFPCEFRNDFRQFMDLIGPDREIKMRNAFQKFRSAALRHTAHDSESKIRMDLFQTFQDPEFADGFAFRLIAHTAGV